MEHRDCGAYRYFFGLDWANVTPPDELSKHKEQVDAFVADMKAEFSAEIPDLTIDAFLLTRDEDDELHMEAP